jgi:SPP1 family predicted phage head-tail adaptor
MFVKLDRLITLQRRVRSQDIYGQEIEVWTPEKEQIWASRQDLTGRERFIAEHTQAVRSAIFTIRYRADINSLDWRIDHDGWIWDIEGLAELRDTRDQYLELTTTAVET